MKKFISQIIVFIFIAIVAGEIIARIFTITSDVPRRIIGEDGIQKYHPFQKGKWKGGAHSWQINALGWPGEAPESFDNLITVIGDSFIENFMNPDECHQNSYLKELMPENNFMEASRSGVSFVEAMEISKQLDTLSPKLHLIYMDDSDLRESIVQIKRLYTITQADLEKEEVVLGKMQSAKLKMILYNWKLAYYFYNRFPINFNFIDRFKKGANGTKEIEVVKPEKDISEDLKMYELLLKYVVNNYNTEDKVLVFKPNTSKEVVDLCLKYNFNCIYLNSKNDKSWTFDYDSHWTCYGHKRAAEQVFESLKNL